MLVVISNKDNTILFKENIINKPQSITDLFPLFDPDAMNWGWSENLKLPSNFQIDKNNYIFEDSIDEYQKIEKGKVVDKTLEDLVTDGLYQLQPFEKIINGEVIQKTLEEQVEDGILTIDVPFEYIKENQIFTYTLEQVISNNLINTLELANELKLRVYKLIENNIAKEYSYSYEVKMIKEYGLWLAENKPTDDYREQNFNTMQARIDNIKSDFVDIIIKAKELVLRYSKV